MTEKEKQNQEDPTPEAKPEDEEPETQPEDKSGDESGEKRFSQEELDRIIAERLEREREKNKRESEEAKNKAEEKARKDALKDQEKFKELYEAESQSVAEKEQRIAELQQTSERLTTIEGLLESMVKSQMDALDKSYKELLSDMPIERRVKWLKDNPELVGTKPVGSPRTPTPQPPKRGKEQDEAAQGARQAQRRTVSTI